MRRVLSWIVLLLLSLAFYICEYWMWALVRIIYLFIYKLSSLLFWIIIVSGGLTLVFLLIGAFSAVIPYIIKWTQSIHHTHNGMRYKVVGVFVVLVFAVFSILVVVSVLKDYTISQPLIKILAYITMVGYGIYLFVSSKKIAAEDGPPLTKRERLQAKLDRLDEKERNRY